MASPAGSAWLQAGGFGGCRDQAQGLQASCASTDHLLWLLQAGLAMQNTNRRPIPLLTAEHRVPNFQKFRQGGAGHQAGKPQNAWKEKKVDSDSTKSPKTLLL